MTFADTLTDQQRHLARRLEGFGDVVFGFSMSQLALQLAFPQSPADLVHPVRFIIYFSTFTLLALLWIVYHRMVSGAFAPTVLDLTLIFTFLAFVSLLPFAMYVYAHFFNHPGWVRTGFGTYIVCALGTTVPSALVARRNLRRGWRFYSDPQRLQLWRRLVVVSTVAALLAFALIVDIAIPVDLAWGVIPPTAVVFMVFPLVIMLSTRMFGRRLPAASVLRIPAEAPVGSS